MLTGISCNQSSFTYRDEKPMPYSNHSINFEEQGRRTNSNFRATNRGFSANRGKAYQPRQQPLKDPDVWDSPPPLEKRKSTHKVGPTGSTRSHQVRNMGSRGQNNNKAKGPANDFLSDRYPNGNGPDTHLI